MNTPEKELIKKKNLNKLKDEVITNLVDFYVPKNHQNEMLDLYKKQKPNLKVVKGESLHSAFYNPAENKIYFSEDYLKKATVSEIVNAMGEECMHYLFLLKRPITNKTKAYLSIDPFLEEFIGVLGNLAIPEVIKDINLKINKKPINKYYTEGKKIKELISFRNNLYKFLIMKEKPKFTPKKGESLSSAIDAIKKGYNLSSLLEHSNQIYSMYAKNRRHEIGEAMVSGNYKKTEDLLFEAAELEDKIRELHGQIKKGVKLEPTPKKKK